MDHSASELNTSCSPSESSNGSPAHKRARGRVRGLPRLLAINALVCGVEIVSSAAFTYIPPLLLKAGYTETVMTIILGIAPFLDMMTVPLLAEWSDRCTSVLGRRRPFIMFLSIVLLLSLILVPYGPTITTIVTGNSSPRINMVILAVGVILLDYSYQALFNPCESLLSDLMATAPEWEQTRGFTVYSAGISLGCILGYLIVSIDWSSAGFPLSQEQTSFSVIFIMFLPCLFLTLFCAKEKPYRRTINFSLQPGEGGILLRKAVTSDNDMLLVKKLNPSVTIQDEMTVLDLTSDSTTYTKDHPSDGGYESGSSETDDTAPLILPSSEMFKWRYQMIIHHVSRLPKITLQKLFNSVLRLLWKIIKILVYLPYQIIKLPLDTWKRVSSAPNVLRRLFLSELFGWMGFMCHNMFFTDFVGQYMYGGLPDAPEHTTLAVLYDEGVRMGSWGLFLHSLTACLYAFCIQQHIVRLVGHRTVYIGGLFIFTVTMAATMISPTVTFLNIVTAMSGVGFAALTSTPNMLVTLYNSDRQLYLWDATTLEGGEERGLGTNVAVLDTAYFLSQLVLSICVGPLVDLTGSALPYMIVATLSGIVSVYCGSRVVFTDVHLKQLRAGAF
ncbi:solute carrier family 45 member 3 [Procambarus clarkii]|uniref:solute carrier family 45 member 3 n=1 Tax=Procambarus clarkii TaxID=6728 RepID=UPI001E670904|nr:solute carrier family 45 member 3-like [Procambarus clarkii]XP_045623899.1 solute carrier family 45 member 3-like [Procambarus clarkii]